VLILQSDAGAPPVVRGVSAPSFDLPRLFPDAAAAGEQTGAATGNRTETRRGSTLRLEDLAGKVVLLNFWATWCEPCTSEMPAMERLYRSLEGERFELVAVSIDEKPGEVIDFAERFGLTFPLVHDADQSVYKAYQTMGVPESLLIDAGGRVVERYVGPREWDAAAYRTRVVDLITSTASGSRPGGGVAPGE
jgi:peroxiredoxin